MSVLRIVRIAGDETQQCVLFIHGVDSDSRRTWTNPRTACFWPAMLAETSGLQTFTIDYAAPTKGAKSSMPLTDRAVSIAEEIRTTPALSGKDLAIVAHSFGGLVAKQMVRFASDNPSRSGGLLDRLAGIAFVATPHVGSVFANLLVGLRLPLATLTAEELRTSNALLRDLDDWFRNHSTAVPPTVALIEMYRYKLCGIRWARVVDPSRANPGLPGTRVIPVDGDHSEIAKPSGPDDLQFKTVMMFLQEAFMLPVRHRGLERCAAAVCYRRKGGLFEFLLVNTSGGRWTFPKGKIERKRTIAEAAELEALQEAGVRGRLDMTPITHYVHLRMERKQNKREEQSITAFLLQVTDEKAAEPERNRNPTWFAEADARRKLREGRETELFHVKEFERVIDLALTRLASTDVSR